MNEQTLTKDHSNQLEKPEYKNQSLLSSKSKKRHGSGFNGKVVKSFKEMDMPQNN